MGCGGLLRVAVQLLYIDRGRRHVNQSVLQQIHQLAYPIQVLTIVRDVQGHLEQKEESASTISTACVKMKEQRAFIIGPEQRGPQRSTYSTAIALSRTGQHPQGSSARCPATVSSA